MNMLETWRPLIDILGWALIHFTWQGTLVALLLAGVLRLLQGASTNARYAAACAALLLMLMAPVATLSHHRVGCTTQMQRNGLSPVSAPQPESQFLAVEIEAGKQSNSICQPDGAAPLVILLVCGTRVIAAVDDPALAVGVVLFLCG